MSGGPFGICQVGCKTGRLEKFIEMGKATLPAIKESPVWMTSVVEQNSFYQIESFCNMVRDYSWIKKLGKEGETHEELVALVRDEVKSSFGIVVEIRGESEQELKQTVSSIKGICYPHDKITVVLSAIKKNLHTQILANMVQELKDDGFGCKLVVHLQDEKQIVDKDTFTEVFKDRRSVLCKLKAGKIVDVDVLNFIDHVINEDLEKIVCFEDETNGIVFIQSSVVNHQYRNYQNYDLMITDILEQSISQKNYRKYETKK